RVLRGDCTGGDAHAAAREPRVLAAHEGDDTEYQGAEPQDGRGGRELLTPHARRGRRIRRLCDWRQSERPGPEPCRPSALPPARTRLRLGRDPGRKQRESERQDPDGETHPAELTTLGHSGALYALEDRRRNCRSTLARAAWRRPICSVAMERGKIADVTTLLADLRERVRVLDERVETLGRHL